MLGGQHTRRSGWRVSGSVYNHFVGFFSALSCIFIIFELSDELMCSKYCG